LAVDQEITEQARSGNFEKLRAWKVGKKESALAAITSFEPTKERPLWGNSSLFRIEDLPWFIFAGRDDPRQKGYDVASSAITRFLEKGGRANFLFFPIPGDEGISGLDFLRKLAIRFPENVLVLPAIFKEGFLAALQGSAFGVMPSFYEPFGMANEFYLNGCVAIGRATGGIIQQIVPVRSIHSFTKAVRDRADIWHNRKAPPIGFLYREANRFSSNEAYWHGLNTTDYQLDGSYPDRIERREQIPLFKAMVIALEDCIYDAVNLYQSQPQRYYQMLTNGIDYILNNFSWEHTAREYDQNLDYR
jgi:glycogen synthase